MNVIDTHLHCWDRDRFHYAWLEGADLPYRFTPADAGPVPTEDRWRAVFMEADRLPGEAIDEARWAMSLSPDGPGIEMVGAVAHAPLGVGASPELTALRAELGVVGIRRLLQDEPLDSFADPALVADLRRVGDAGLVFDACVRDHQLQALAELADRCPGTTIVLDHLGKPDVSDPSGARIGGWIDGVRSLAARENVVVKLSGILPVNGPFAGVRPWVLAGLEAFGPERVVVGSDWPVSRRPEDAYEDWFRFVLTDCELAADEVDAVSHANAERIYGV
ncbi:MAG: amidohydrolase family protein [Curtobacterium sp.]